MKDSSVVRIDKRILEDIRILSEAENKSMFEFMNELISDGLNRYFCYRSGGAVGVLRNPWIRDGSKGDKEEFRTKLNEVSKIIESAYEQINELGAEWGSLFQVMLFYHDAALYTDDEIEKYEKWWFLHKDMFEVYKSNRKEVNE